jgi:hypothetical protein
MGSAGTKAKPKSATAPANAFTGWSKQPTDQEFASALGAAKNLWEELVRGLGDELRINSEWGSSSLKTGWSLRMKHKDRIILYVIPNAGSFHAALVLGDNAVKAAKETPLPPRITKIISESRRYAEGTGVRIPVRGRDDLIAIRQLARIKLEN